MDMGLLGSPSLISYFILFILDNDSFSFDGQVVRVINYGKFRFCLGVSLIGVDGVWAGVWASV